MTGDCHVRFCERLRGETPLCLLGGKKDLCFTRWTQRLRSGRGFYYFKNFKNFSNFINIKTYYFDNHLPQFPMQ